MDVKEKEKQQAAINVWGIANIGCEMVNPTFQTLVVSHEEQIATPHSQREKAQEAEVMEDIVDDTSPTPEGKIVTSAPPVVQETFADRVKAIMHKAATKNGQQIETSAKGHAGTYLYSIDAEAFCKAMDEMVSTYGEKLKELLGGTLNCLQVTKVCFFIGSVVRMHVINDVHLQTVDMLFAFEEYYDNLQTVKAKLGDKKATRDQKVVLGYFEGLLRKYTA